MMISLALAAALTGLLQVAEPDPDLTPARVSLEQLQRDGFDTRWRLPEQGEDGFTASMERLASWKDSDSGETFGDLVAACREDPTSADERIDRFLADHPALAESWGEALRELLLDDVLRGPEWDPDEDDPRDGFLFGAPDDRRRFEGQPWSSLRGSSAIQQAATLIHADLHAFKTVENDYRAYPEHVGNSYERIGAVPGTWLLGQGSSGRPFMALQIEFRCDLPFPFGTYDCRLHVLNAFDERGRMVSDVYSTSEDFLWMAGRDTLLPVSDGEGRFVALLLVRRFGFDLAGVPDGDGARRAAIRGGVGNLKRRAEALFEQRERELRAPEAPLSAIEVSGWVR
jgi:hypothetical protein